MVAIDPGPVLVKTERVAIVPCGDARIVVLATEAGEIDWQKYRSESVIHDVPRGTMRSCLVSETYLL